MFEVYLDHLSHTLHVYIKENFINVEKYPEEYLDYVYEITEYVNEHMYRPLQRHTVEEINSTIRLVTEEYNRLYPNFVLRR